MVNMSGKDQKENQLMLQNKKFFCHIWIKCVANEEDINGDARVSEQCENEEHGEYECIPDCDERIKPHLGQRFQTLDEGVRYYKEYVAFVGFDIRGSTYALIESVANGRDRFRTQLCV
nr:protein FAR1-RELATED SEQUENCE 5-like [Ipomoea batatas]